MHDTYKNWNECSTLSKQIREGMPVAQEFSWKLKENGDLVIKAKMSSMEFSSDDYSAMVEHINSYKSGIQLGSSRDSKVSTDSLGALMASRRNTNAIRGWCSHLAAVAVQRGDIKFMDKGIGPGKGIWLYPQGADS